MVRFPAGSVMSLRSKAAPSRFVFSAFLRIPRLIFFGGDDFRYSNKLVFVAEVDALGRRSLKVEL